MNTQGNGKHVVQEQESATKTPWTSKDRAGANSSTPATSRTFCSNMLETMPASPKEESKPYAKYITCCMVSWNCQKCTSSPISESLLALDTWLAMRVSMPEWESCILEWAIHVLNWFKYKNFEGRSFQRRKRSNLCLIQVSSRIHKNPIDHHIMIYLLKKMWLPDSSAQAWAKDSAAHPPTSSCRVQKLEVSKPPVLQYEI